MCVRTGKKQGFSLIELMIVVSIIGLLAAIAVPNFQKYSLKAKLAEAYTTLGMLKTLQITSHTDEGYFRRLLMVQDSNLSNGIFAGGSKRLMYRIGDPALDSFIGTDTRNYFGYNSYGGFYDSAGDHSDWSFNGSENEVDTAAFQVSTGMRVLDPDGGGQIGGCQVPVSASDMGLAEVAGEHYFKQYALADFSDASHSICTTVLNFVTTTGQGYTSSPMITLNLGE